MNKEEIEKLKDFTIDLTDIDELALGLEVCSKKSNMVIQDFADTIIQLQQENQSLKKENKILRENAEHNDKVVDKVNWENKHYKHIIDELEKWLKEKLKDMQLIIDDVDIAFEVDYERINEAKNYKVAYNTALNKLQELKGSDKQ